MKKIRLKFLYFFILMTVPIFSQKLTAEELQRMGINGIENFIEYFQETGRHDNRTSIEALKNLHQSIELFKKKKKFEELSLSQIKIGDLYRMKNQFDLAYTYYQRALTQAVETGNKRYQAGALVGKAQVEILSFHQYGNAEKNLNKALDVLENMNLKKEYIKVLNLKAQLEMEENDFASASLTLDKAFAFMRNNHDDKVWFQLYVDKSSIHFNLGRVCDYMNIFPECKNEFIIAKLNTEKALKIARRLKWKFHIDLLHIALNNIQNNLNFLLMRENSKKKWDKGSYIFHPKKATDMDKFVHEYFILSKLKDDFPWMAAEIKTMLLASNFFGVETVNTVYLKGLQSEAEGKIEEALKIYMEAVNLLELQRKNLDTLKRGDFLNDKMQLYYKPLLHLLKLKRKEEAFVLFERSRAKSLLDLIDTKKRGESKELEKFSNLMQLSTEIAVLKNQIVNQNTIEKNSDLKELEKRYKEKMELAKMTSQHIPPLIPSLQQVQEELKKGKYEILQYLIQENQVIIWHIKEDKIDIKCVFLPKNELSTKVNSIYKSVKNSKFSFDEISAKELFLFLIQPMLKNINSKKIVIIPHYELTKLPFQLLINPENNKSLGEKFQISYAPSISILMGLSPIKNLKNRKILALADNSMSSGVKEIQKIASLYPNTTILSHRVSKETFYKKIKGHDIVHLSVHGVYRSRNPMLSYLKMGEENREEKLRALEMFSMPLAKNSLVVLSACESGRVQVTQSNETLGIVRGLLYAGADTLLLSSWKVDEEATALWMETFYKVAQTESLAEASRQAIIKVKNIPKYSHPHYWAGFSMIGK